MTSSINMMKQDHHRVKLRHSSQTLSISTTWFDDNWIQLPSPNNNYASYIISSFPYFDIRIRFHELISLFLPSKYLYPKWTKHRNRSVNHQENVHHILYIIFFCIIMCSLPSSTLSECKFPEHWLGYWFQKGVSGTIHIKENSISNKGWCRKNIGEKFIIENRNDKCFRCLVISERHANILQYKETSYCYPVGEYSPEFLSNDICFDINGDAPLFSLFRVNTSPIKCPFEGPFTFSYSKSILSECKDPLSTIDECTDDRHLLFKFRACIDIAGSESKEEQLECLADWKEGSNRYMVGKLYHSSATTDEDRFRCFVIEKNNSDVVESYNIGQSGDASCEGLFSPRDGSRTFKLRKAHQVKPSCDFPSWLMGSRRWTTLDNRHHYDFSALNQFTVYDMKNEVIRTAKCIHSDDVSFLYRFNTTRLIIHTTVQCKSGYACMHIYQRENRITELQIGNIVPDYQEACSSVNFQIRPTNYITLTALDQETRPCELNGIFSIRTRVPYSNPKLIANSSRMVSLLDARFLCQEKALKLRSNCDEPELFQFICTTDNRVKNFYCRGGWKENSTQYILVSLKDKFNYEHCIAYNSETKEIRSIRNSHFCYRNDDNIQDPLAPWSGPFRPHTTNVDNTYNLPKYASIPKYDDSVSVTLINEGSCQQRSAAVSSFHSAHLNYEINILSFIILWLLSSLNVLFFK